MNVKLNTVWLYGALISVLSFWILHGFLEAVLAACVTAIASWPLYERFATLLRRRIGRSAISLLFTSLMAMFVLTPLLFAFGALLVEAHALLMQIASADKSGIAVPQWLESVPLIGPWVVARWQNELAHPGALAMWTLRTDPATLIGWAQSLGHFTARHVFIILFTILILFFLYQKGESLAEDVRRALRHWVGQRAEGHADLAARAVRASINSMLVVGLFDGIATWVAYAVAGVPQAAVWAAITGLLALVPLLGYVAVLALTLQLTMMGAGEPTLLSFVLGCTVLFCGDKIVRPVVARDGTRLPFVWVLMGCLGGFEVIGLVGVVIGPVVLTLAKRLWEERVRDLRSYDRREFEVLG